MNSEKANENRWPFDPMQPGDHEPARVPDEADRVQKQSGRRAQRPAPDDRTSEEKGR